MGRHSVQELPLWAAGVVGLGPRLLEGPRWERAQSLAATVPLKMEVEKGAVVRSQALILQPPCHYFVVVCGRGGGWTDRQKDQESVMLGGKRAGTTVPMRHEARGVMMSQGRFRGQLVTGVSSECDEKERRGWDTAFVPS